MIDHLGCREHKDLNSTEIIFPDEIVERVSIQALRDEKPPARRSRVSCRDVQYSADVLRFHLEYFLKSYNDEFRLVLRNVAEDRSHFFVGRWLEASHVPRDQHCSNGLGVVEFAVVHQVEFVHFALQLVDQDALLVLDEVLDGLVVLVLGVFLDVTSIYS